MRVKKGGILAGFRVEKLLERGYKFFFFLRGGVG
jgi:hypothetical protein